MVLHGTKLFIGSLFNEIVCYYILLHSIKPKCICRSVSLAISMNDGFNVIKTVCLVSLVNF